MNMNDVKVIKVDHVNEMFWELSTADALEQIFFNGYDCDPIQTKDFNVSFTTFMDDNTHISFEAYKLGYIEKYYERLQELDACFYENNTHY